MKKLLFLSAIGIAGMMSASNTGGNDPVENNENKKLEKTVLLQQDCWQYSVTPSCSDTEMYETVCVEVGNTQDYHRAHQEMINTIDEYENDHCGGGAGTPVDLGLSPF